LSRKTELVTVTVAENIYIPPPYDPELLSTTELVRDAVDESTYRPPPEIEKLDLKDEATIVTSDCFAMRVPPPALALLE
jgi:hypothetical protein